MEAIEAFDVGTTLEAHEALVFYAGQETGRPHGGPGGGGEFEATSLVTRHRVQLSEGQSPVLLGGRVVSGDELRALFGAVCEAAPQKRALLDERLLFSDGTRLLWWRRARRRPMQFSTADQQFNRDVSDKPALHPTLLFLARPGNLYVFALEEEARPQAGTLVWTAPYCNLYTDGHMCNGNVKTPRSLEPEAIDAWEEIFFDSAFTHSNLTSRITAHKEGHNGLWREMVKPPRATSKVTKRTETFPAKYLMPSLIYSTTPPKATSRPRTVEDVLNQ